MKNIQTVIRLTDQFRINYRKKYYYHSYFVICQNAGQKKNPFGMPLFPHNCLNGLQFTDFYIMSAVIIFRNLVTNSMTTLTLIFVISEPFINDVMTV